MRQLKVLLIQARRHDDPAREEELRSFAARSGLPEDRITPHSLLDRPPSVRELKSYDALMIGGSGEYYVSKEDLPSFGPFLDFLTEVTEIGHPTFASCFGFQCMVRALGGDVIHDPANTEVGTYRLTLTGEGREDGLFRFLPETFQAQMGRKDRAARLPDGVLNLAYSDLCPFQALRIPGQPVWASQFHPELDRETNRQRFFRYMEGYAAHMSREDREEALNRFEDSPATMDLLQRFLRLVFG